MSDIADIEIDADAHLWYCDTITNILVYRRESKNLAFLRLRQSQNNNVKFMCIRGNPVSMNSEQRGVIPSWD
jgi:hypothetical protein